ncbi:MAG: AbrB/MazE/SpoVT family DNA-binding domain-containing protein [Dehalococcoidia bacterium]
MREYLSSVSPKGQITIPAEVRRLLKIQPKDKVAIDVREDGVRIRRADAGSFLASYQAIPALPRKLSVEEMAQIAAEEHAEQAAKDGL